MPENERPKLTLIRGLTAEQRHVIHLISNSEFCSGSWEQALSRRDELLRYDYDRPDIAEADVERRMAALMSDIDDALNDLSLLRGSDFPHEAVKKSLLGIGMANVVDDFVGTSTDLAEENRVRHGRQLVDDLWRAAVLRTGTEGVHQWLHERGRPSPNNSDLVRIALYEMNADRIGAALPRVLVLPNSHDAFKPCLIRVADDVETDAETAGALRILFSY